MVADEPGVQSSPGWALNNKQRGLLGILVPVRRKYAPLPFFFHPAGIYWLLAAYTFKMGDKNRGDSPHVVIQHACTANKKHHSAQTKEAPNMRRSVGNIIPLTLHITGVIFFFFIWAKQRNITIALFV